MKTKTVKLSLCPCGFPVLADDIPLGTQYEVDPERQAKGTLICGGCKTHLSVGMIWVEARGDSQAGYLPAEIFYL